MAAAARASTATTPQHPPRQAQEPLRSCYNPCRPLPFNGAADCDSRKRLVRNEAVLSQVSRCRAIRCGAAGDNTSICPLRSQP